VLPFAETIEGLTGSVFDVFLAPYFREAYRPIKQGNTFTCRAGSRVVEFRIVEVYPPKYGIVAADTVIHCEGTPIVRSDEERSSLNDTGFDDIGGYDQQKTKMRELIEFSVDSQYSMLTKAVGMASAAGILVYGPSGKHS
jgi:transitional endoplasmic reticulum ATPase